MTEKRKLHFHDAVKAAKTRAAERAKQRYKDLAVFGIIVIGVIVGVHEEASGNGTAFAAASAIGVMIVLGIVLGIVALAIRIDHRRRQ